jgi:hypothetical protein
MAYRTRRLTGPGRLSADDFDGQVHYALLHRSEDVPAPNPSGPESTSTTSIAESITGRVEVQAGLLLPRGITMILTLHDGNKLKVTTEAGGKVTGIGGFFR